MPYVREQDLGGHFHVKYKPEPATEAETEPRPLTRAEKLQQEAQAMLQRNPLLKSLLTKIEKAV